MHSPWFSWIHNSPNSWVQVLTKPSSMASRSLPCSAPWVWRTAGRTFLSLPCALVCRSSSSPSIWMREIIDRSSVLVERAKVVNRSYRCNNSVFCFLYTHCCICLVERAHWTTWRIIEPKEFTFIPIHEVHKRERRSSAFRIIHFGKGGCELYGLHISVDGIGESRSE